MARDIRSYDSEQDIRNAWKVCVCVCWQQQRQPSQLIRSAAS